MGWNYRVVRHCEADPATGERTEWFAIHEAYYRSNEVDDLTVPSEEVGLTVDPVTVNGDSVEDLRETLKLMLEALDKPALEYS